MMAFRPKHVEIMLEKIIVVFDWFTVIFLNNYFPNSINRSHWPRGLRCGSLVSVVCCQVEVSASGWSPVQRGPTECGVSECDREASILRRPWPTRGCCAMKKKHYEPIVLSSICSVVFLWGTNTQFKSVPCLKWLVTGLSPWRPGVENRPAHLRFVVDQVALV
jgi:hypothetical protein